MYRATTPTHTFTLPLSTDTLSEILVSYKQGTVRLDKHYQDNVLPSGMTLDGAMYEITRTPANTMHALVDTTKYYASNANVIYQAGNFVREVYYSSGTAITYYASAAYGYNQTVTAPAMNSGTGSTLTLKSPAFIVRGSTSYFVNTYMNAVSDVRYQYVIDVYRAPKANLNLDGWGLTQQWLKMNDDILNNNGKLT